VVLQHCKWACSVTYCEVLVNVALNSKQGILILCHSFPIKVSVT
jgi:hypothetical protein